VCFDKNFALLNLNGLSIGFLAKNAQIRQRGRRPPLALQREAVIAVPR